jgi:hypothetical protein
MQDDDTRLGKRAEHQIEPARTATASSMALALKSAYPEAGTDVPAEIQAILHRLRISENEMPS